MKAYNILIILFLTANFSQEIIGNTTLPLITSYLEAKQQSKENGKDILAFFTTSEKNYIDISENQIDKINLRYIPLLININSFEGATLKEHYKVEAMPAILIIKSDGSVVKRTNQVLKSDDLSFFLNLNGKRPVDNLSTEPFIDNSVHSGSKNSVLVSPEKNKNDEIKIETPNDEMGNSSIVYGIQTGVYSDQSNANKQCVQYKRLFNEPVRMTKIIKDGKALYKVIIGEFESEQLARDFNLILLDYNIKGFIKKVSSGSKL